MCNNVQIIISRFISSSNLLNYNSKTQSIMLVKNPVQGADRLRFVLILCSVLFPNGFTVADGAYYNREILVGVRYFQKKILGGIISSFVSRHSVSLIGS